MSCGTCPDSAGPTIKKDGSSAVQNRMQWGTNVGDWYHDQRAKGLPPVVQGVTAPAFVLPATPEEAAPLLSEQLGQLTGEPIAVKPLALDGQDTWLFIEPHQGLLAEQHETLVQLGLPRGTANGMQDREGRWSLTGLSPHEWPGWMTRLQAVREAQKMLQHHPGLADQAAAADECVFYASGTRATLLCRQGDRLTYFQLTPDNKLKTAEPDLADTGTSAEEEIRRVRENGAGWLLCLRCGGPVTAGECLRCGQEEG